MIVARRAGHGCATLNGPERDGVAVLNEAQDPVVIGLNGVRSEARRDLSAHFEGVRDLGDAPDGGLGREIEALAHIAIGELVQGVLAKDMVRKTLLGQPGAGFVATAQRVAEGLGLLPRGLELDRCDQLLASRMDGADPEGNRAFLRRLNPAVSGAQIGKTF